MGLLHNAMYFIATHVIIIISNKERQALENNLSFYSRQL